MLAGLGGLFVHINIDCNNLWRAFAFASVVLVFGYSGIPDIIKEKFASEEMKKNCDILGKMKGWVKCCWFITLVNHFF